MKSKKKQIRENFRNACLKRDGYRCVMCGFKPENSEELDSHHIIDRHDIAAGGYVKENGIILCTDRSPSSPNCHLKAEQYHITGEAYGGFAPLNLFIKIGSSEELARKAAKQLEKEN